MTAQEQRLTIVKEMEKTHGKLGYLIDSIAVNTPALTDDPLGYIQKTLRLSSKLHTLAAKLDALSHLSE